MYGNIIKPTDAILGRYCYFVLLSLKNDSVDVTSAAANSLPHILSYANPKKVLFKDIDLENDNLVFFTPNVDLGIDFCIKCLESIVKQTLDSEYIKIFEKVNAKTLKSRSFANRAAQTEKLNQMLKVVSGSQIPHQRVLAFYNSFPFAINPVNSDWFDAFNDKEDEITESIPIPRIIESSSKDY